MYPINIDFDSCDDVPTSWLFGGVGVYVLWAPNAWATPTYIGEGDLLARLQKHTTWLSKNVIGTIAVMGYQGEQKKKAKRNAKIAEAFMLELARDLGRWPRKNDSQVNYLPRLERLFREQGPIRLTVGGYHVFKRPDGGHAELTSRQRHTLRFQYDGNEVFPEWDTPWRGRS